jgi:hypothetical protein
MLVRIVVAALVAGVLLMGWSFVFWTMLPLSNSQLERVPTAEEAALLETLKKSLPASGSYLLPYPEAASLDGSNPDARTAFLERHKAGPLVAISYNKDGVDLLSPLTLACGFGHFVGSALLAGLILAMASPSLPNIAMRWVFVVLLGVFAAVALDLQGVCWLLHPPKGALLHAAYHASCWAIAAIPLAAIIRWKSSEQT